MGVKDAHWNALGDGLVRFFQESGPVLTKLGQILATRSDILPKAVCERLEVLYDQQPPMSRKELDRILKSNYARRFRSMTSTSGRSRLAPSARFIAPF